MRKETDFLLDLSFVNVVIHWRGPAPYFFVAVPAEYVDDVRQAAQLASYGWGVVPVAASIGDVEFRTSLFPRRGGYLLPLKVAVRRDAGIELGDVVRVSMRVAATPA